MEYIPGPTLEGGARGAAGRRPGQQSGAGRGRAASCTGGVIHLDLSPDNVMFRPGGERCCWTSASRGTGFPALQGAGVAQDGGVDGAQRVLGVR
jgi:hypothetical protein